MIRIDLFYDGPHIVSCTISGHAGAATKGEDLVCAGVSAIGVGTLNALAGECQNSLTEVMEPGYIRIDVTSINDVQQCILMTMLYQLQTMQIAHPQYINITKQEV